MANDPHRRRTKRQLHFPAPCVISAVPDERPRSNPRLQVRRTRPEENEVQLKQQRVFLQPAPDAKWLSVARHRRTVVILDSSKPTC